MQSTDMKRKPFRNEEAYEALRLATESLHEYDESSHKSVLGYENGEEIILDKDNCLSLVFRYKPISVLVFIETHALGRGTCSKGNGLTCTDGCSKRDQDD